MYAKILPCLNCIYNDNCDIQFAMSEVLPLINEVNSMTKNKIRIRCVKYEKKESEEK